MRLLVVEFVTGGGLVAADPPAGLVRDGDIMLHSLLRDLAELSGLRLVTTRDARLAALAPTPAGGVEVVQVVPVRVGDDPWALWLELIVEADAVWPIAPETGRALALLTDMVVASGRRLLGSRPDAVRDAGSKRTTAALLGAPPDRGAGWVAKPEDGAGCEHTRLFPDHAGAVAWAATRLDPAGVLVQPHAPGPAASLSVLCAGGRARLLACNRQRVELEDGAFRYRGVAVGAREGHRVAYTVVADRVAAAFPGLWGHAGVDLIDGPDGPVVLDVNPRLTAAYPGLRAHLGVNPAALALALPDG